MSTGALILTYHAIEPGPPPLCLEPELLRAHLDLLVESGVSTLTVSELATGLGAGHLPDRAVVLTFDDGAESAVHAAAPLLDERGLRATFFCVAGHLGGINDWPSEPPRSPRLRLADAAALRDLSAAGFEVGSHGWSHLPLRGIDNERLLREVAESRRALEDAIHAPVDSFAYPHAVAPDAAARQLAATTYRAACQGGTARVKADADPHALPRVDAHYLRALPRLRRALTGADGYLRARRIAAGARRRFRADYVEVR